MSGAPGRAKHNCRGTERSQLGHILSVHPEKKKVK